MDELIPKTWRAISKPAAVALGLATAIWFPLIFPYLPWTNLAFAALLTTPLLTALWLRIRTIKTIGMRMLPRADAFRLYGWTAVAVVSVYMFICSLEYLRGRSAYAALKQEVAAKNASLSLASVIPPEVPDEDNFCATPLLQSQVEFPDEVTFFNRMESAPSPHHQRLESLRLPRHRDEWMFAKLADLEAVGNAMNTNRFGAGLESDSAAFRILRSLEKQSALVELREAMSRPQARWNLPYESGWFVSLATGDRDAALNRITQTLRLRALAALAEDQPDLALDAVRICFRLANSLKREPSPFASERRHQMLHWTIAPIWEGLARRAWEANHLTKLQGLLGQLNPADDREQDRINAIVWMSFWPAAQETLTIGNLFKHWSEPHNDPAEILGFTLIFAARPSGWSHLNMVNTYRWFAPDEPEFRRLPTDPLAGIFFVPKFEAMRAFRQERRPLFHLTYAQARVACALERHWLQHKKYPERLEALVPEWLEGLPALSYRRTPNGRYLLHSPEQANVPDAYQPLAGRSERRAKEHGDSVWRYPSSGQ